MVFGLILGAAIGFALYKDCTNFERQYGKGPWGGSALLWGIVGLLFGLFAALFYWIASRSTKKQARMHSVMSPQQYFDSNRYAAPPQPYAAVPPPAQWGAPPAPMGPPPAPAGPPPQQWSPPGAPPVPPGPAAPPAPNVGGSDFLPRR